MRLQDLGLFKAPLRVLFGACPHIRQKCLPIHPPDIGDLGGIKSRLRITRKADQYRAELVLQNAIAKNLIAVGRDLFHGGKFHAQFLAATPPRRLLVRFVDLRMAAHRIRPHQREDPLLRASLLRQYLALAVEQEQRKTAMERSVAMVHLGFRHRAEHHIQLIDQHYVLSRHITPSYWHLPPRAIHRFLSAHSGTCSPTHQKK